MTEATAKAIQVSVEEIETFEHQGYLVLDEFLPADLVSHLSERLKEAIERRKAGAKPSQGAIHRDGNDIRIMHILNDDSVFLKLVDHPPMVAYVQALLQEEFHFHASDAIWEENLRPHGQPGWHMDGWDQGYRSLRPHVPHLQFKVGYYLSDMRDSDQGNLVLVPGSHRGAEEPTEEQRSGFDTFPGAIQVCGAPGTAIVFHNAVWHSRGPATRPGGRRVMLYYAYERPWMIGNPEHWQYPPEFYASLSTERRKLFHGFVFDPPEDRPF